MSSRRRDLFWRLLLIFVLILPLVTCAKQEPPPVDPHSISPLAGPELDQILAVAAEDTYLPQVSFAPQDAEYYELVDNVFNLTPDERSLLAQNGFVITDRKAFADFTTAYAWIYWRDLPVLVTTDSILHSIHQTYDDLLKQLEETILTEKLRSLLAHALGQIRADAKAGDDPDLKILSDDVIVYLTVALGLLKEKEAWEYRSEGVRQYLELATTANTVAEIDLFGKNRRVDFTLFEPRGHYTESEDLERYFWAMSWLAQVDFRFVEYDPHGNPTLNLEHLAAAVLLRDAIDKADQRDTWEEIDMLVGALIGRSDNVTLPDLDRFLADAGLASASDILHHPNPDQLLTLLTTNDYGQQRITGQILSVAPNNPAPQPRPISFMLFGQRFAVDSYLMSNLVYDRLVVDGQKVQRPLPSPLDVMYALGNDRALVHLENEFSQYGYQGNLTALRLIVDGIAPDFWTSNVYNRWLNALRQLDGHTTGKAYPQAMRTAAWADKMLHTQLASWAQLRHDNILYAKRSETFMPVCEYPAGYVEPFPEFYLAVGDYARAGRMIFDNVNPAGLSDQGRQIYKTTYTYFDNLDQIAYRLRIMAEKELRQEPFSPEEERFLKSVAIHQLETVDNICAIVTVERWDGWYLDLFPWQDDNPALIADVHTNPNNNPGFPDLYPPSVLHVATGPVAPIFFIADTDEGPAIYVGPAFTYFEVVEQGYPSVRLTDEAWDARLNTTPRLAPPEWTKSFRLPTTELPTVLKLPEP